MKIVSVSATTTQLESLRFRFRSDMFLAHINSLPPRKKPGLLPATGVSQGIIYSSTFAEVCVQIIDSFVKGIVLRINRRRRTFRESF